MGNKVIETKNIFNEIWNEKDYPTLEQIYNLFSKYIKEVLKKEGGESFIKETTGLSNPEKIDLVTQHILYTFLVSAGEDYQEWEKAKKVDITKDIKVIEYLLNYHDNLQGFKNIEDINPN